MCIIIITCQVICQASYCNVGANNSIIVVKQLHECMWLIFDKLCYLVM